MSLLTVMREIPVFIEFTLAGNAKSDRPDGQGKGRHKKPFFRAERLLSIARASKMSRFCGPVAQTYYSKNFKVSE